MEDSYVEYICDRPPAASRFFGDTNSESVFNNEKQGSACCHHDQHRRKYVLNFEKVTEDCAGSAAEEERRRCRNFWEFIDSEPTLQSLIKDGQFIHTSLPEKLGGCEKTDCCDGGLPMDDPELRSTMTKVLENRARERENFAKLQEKIRELQRKSGQPLNAKTSVCAEKKKGHLLAHMLTEDLDEELASIRDYDEKKIQLKPKKKPEPPTPFKSLLMENQLVKAEYFIGSDDDEEAEETEEEFEESEQEANVSEQY